MAIAKTGAVVTHDIFPTMMADSSPLVQLFQNLLGNAIKLHGEEPRHVHVSAEPQRSKCFSCDKDLGIESEYAEHIFVIFQRLYGRVEYLDGRSGDPQKACGTSREADLDGVAAWKGLDILLHTSNDARLITFLIEDFRLC